MTLPHFHPDRACAGLLSFFLLTISGWAYVIDSSAWINEFHYDNAGTDTGEFVEIVLPTNLQYSSPSDYSLTFYNGNDQQAEATYSLTTFTTTRTSGDFTFYSKAISGIQNGGDTASGTSNPDGLCLSYNGTVLQFLSYEGSFTAADGVAQGKTSTDIGVREHPTAGTPLDGFSLQLSGTGNSYSDFTWQAPAGETPAALNNGQTVTAKNNADEPGSAAAGIIINEINADPGTDANGDSVVSADTDEFVEIVNTSSQAVDISGWKLTEGGSATARITFPDGTIIPAGGSLVIFDGTAGFPTQSAFGGAIVFASTSDLALNNDGDTVTLTSDLGTVIATYTYGTEANNDLSLSRNPDLTGGFAQATASPGTTVTGNSFSGSSFVSSLPANRASDMVLDFDSFDGSGFSPNPATGQLDSDNISFTGLDNGDGAGSGDTAYGLTYTAGDHARGTSSGGETTGGIYAFDVGGGNYALGIQPGGGDFLPGAITLRLPNSTGKEIDILYLSYDLYVLNDGGYSSSFDLQYSTDGVTYLDLVDFSSPEVADGSAVWVKNEVVLTLSDLNLRPDQVLYLRYVIADLSGSGTRDEFALDNLVFHIPEPSSILLLTGLAGLLNLRRRR